MDWNWIVYLLLNTTLLKKSLTIVPSCQLYYKQMARVLGMRPLARSPTSVCRVFPCMTQLIVFPFRSIHRVAVA